MFKNKSIKRKVSAMLEIPKELALNLPLVTITGSEELLIENYKSVIEYSDDRIRISTSCGVLQIYGHKLLLKHITSEDISVSGTIKKLEYTL